VTFEIGAVQVTCEHCGGGLVVEQGTRLVRLGCPRCGGNFYYIDGSLCGHCPYCDASLLALARDRVLRYVVRPEAEAPAEAEGAELMFLPFWHLGGLLYAWQVGKKVEVVEDRSMAVDHQDGSGGDAVGKIRKDSGPKKAWAGRVLNQTLPDPASSAFGVTSLRLRAAVFPLEPFGREHEQLGRVVPSTLDHQRAKEKLFAHTMRLASAAEGLTQVDCQRFDLVAEALSLYYYPFWVLKKEDGSYALWDAVSGRAERTATPVEAPAAPERGIFDELQLIELNCSACGAVLPAGNHSVVLPCRGCGRFWQVTRQGLAPFEAHYALPRVAAQGTPVWLPFWRINAQLSYAGKPANQVADLVKVLGVMIPPGDKPKAAPDSALCFFVPAFGALKAPRVDHAARDLTRYQPALEQTQPGKGELYNCFFGEDDARALGYATWILVVQGTVPHRIRSLRIETGAARLWYVPFDEDPGGRELINLLTGVRYERAAFRGVRH